MTKMSRRIVERADRAVNWENGSATYARPAAAFRRELTPGRDTGKSPLPSLPPPGAASLRVRRSRPLPLSEV
ncbi:hypothetical protein AcidC75_30980 [Acidisoma sp. C75]